MFVANGVDDDDLLAVPFRPLERPQDPIGARLDALQIDQSDLSLRLALQHAHEVGVAHRRQWVVAHRAFRQQRVADKQMAFENRAGVCWEGGASDGEIGARQVHQRFGDGTDVALVGRIEGRAILENELLGAGGQKPSRRGDRHGDCVFGRDRARLQRHDDGVGVAEVEFRARRADRLNRLHAFPRQCQRKVGRARQVVGNRAQQHQAVPFRLFFTLWRRRRSRNRCRRLSVRRDFRCFRGPCGQRSCRFRIDASGSSIAAAAGRRRC